MWQCCRCALAAQRDNKRLFLSADGLDGVAAEAIIGVDGVQVVARSSSPTKSAWPTPPKMAAAARVEPASSEVL
jgi:hypothetical protein